MIDVKHGLNIEGDPHAIRPIALRTDLFPVQPGMKFETDGEYFEPGVRMLMSCGLPIIGGVEIEAEVLAVKGEGPLLKIDIGGTSNHGDAELWIQTEPNRRVGETWASMGLTVHDSLDRFRRAGAQKALGIMIVKTAGDYRKRLLKEICDNGVLDPSLAAELGRTAIL